MPYKSQFAAEIVSGMRIAECSTATNRNERVNLVYATIPTSQLLVSDCKSIWMCGRELKLLRNVATWRGD